MQGLVQGHAEDLAQLLLEEVSAIERSVGPLNRGQLGLLLGREVRRVLPEGPAGATDLIGHGGLALAAGVVPDGAADLVQGVRGPGDDMERVETETGVGAVGVDRLGDPCAGVGADQGDAGAALAAEQEEEAADGLGVPAGCGVQAIPLS